MKALLVAGARPNFMKVAPILRKLDERGHEGVLVHTGQHYDDEMSDAFFKDLEIPPPDHYLGVGSASHAVQTARVMEAFEPVLEAELPDWVVVVGDVNSTLACALVTSKLRHHLECKLAHVEAGLRSRDWRMPEEVNRVLTDRLADLLLTPSRDADTNLREEGIEAGKIQFVGNVMIDSLLHRLPEARKRQTATELGVNGREYAVATVHRPSNVDDPGSLRRVLDVLRTVSTEEMPVVLPLHPRTKERVSRWDFEDHLDGVVAVEPLSYLDMISLMDGADLVLTDSGGIQEEATALGVPCVTLREQTERPITVENGTNRLAPWPLTVEGVREAIHAAIEEQDDGVITPDGWDGRTAIRIVKLLEI